MSMLTNAEFSASISHLGWELVGEYAGKAHKVSVRCVGCGRLRTSKASNISGGCKDCIIRTGREALGDSILKEALSEGYKLEIVPVEGKKFNNFRLVGTCPNNHNINMIINNWIFRKQRCSACCGNRKLTLEVISLGLAKESYSVKDGQVYDYNSGFLQFICDRGHEYTSSWSKWDDGIRCSVCNGGLPLTQEQAIERIEAKGIFRYVGGVHESNKSYFNVTCVANNHSLTVRFDGLAYEDRECATCSKAKGRSKAEVEIEEWLVGLGYNVVVSDREQVQPLELDIYLPDQKLAIEYCGLYYHSVLFKDWKYHQGKYAACQDKGIRLITIFEDEWARKKEQLKGLIRSKLRVGRNRVQARKCEITKIYDTSVANNFVDRWHVQGSSKQTAHSWGAWHSGDLIGVVCLSRHHRNTGEWVINRLAFHPDYVSPGLFQRMLSKVVEHCQGNQIKTLVTFSDCRFSSGALYERSGFRIDGKIRPDYSYTRGLARVSKQSMKKKLEEKSEGKTEEQLRALSGYRKIYDCGKIRWLINVSPQTDIPTDYSEKSLPALPLQEPRGLPKHILSDAEMKVRKRITSSDAAAKKCFEAAGVELVKETHINAHTKATFICPKHGEFASTPSSVMQGHGHPNNKLSVPKSAEYFANKFPASIKVEVLKFEGMRKQASVIVNGTRYDMIAANLVQKLKNSKLI